MSDRRIYPDELAHFGILGMKWGKRNGPPYPLDAKDHSASEKKAGWSQSLKAKKTEKYESTKNDALKFLDYSRKAYAESAEGHEKKVSSYRKDPEKVIKRETWKIGTGKNSQTRSYEVKAKDLISYHQEEALSDRKQEKYYSDLIKRYGNMSVSDMNKSDLAYLKKWGRQYTKFYAGRDM